MSNDVQIVRHYQRNPLDWVRDTFGENLRREGGVQTVTGLTSQQEDAFRKIGDLVAAKMDVAAGVVVDDDRRELASKIGLSIQSGQGTGKDFFAAMCLMWFMSNFSMCKCLATANTAKQLRNVYWAEISKVMRLSRRIIPDDPTSEPILEHLFEWQSERVFLREFRGKEWFAEAVTINARASEEDQATALAGRHEKHMLFVVDEASGIPDPVFRPLEGTLTGKVNIVLLIYNPTRSRGFAIDSQRDPRFLAIRWNSEESEMVSKAHVEGMLAKYGKDSNTYRIRVLGLPPLADSDTLIPWDWIDDARDRVIEPDDGDPLIQGIDVGGGGDKSVSCRRWGGKVLPLERYNSKNTMEVAAWAARIYDVNDVTAAFVDLIGIGRGVFDRLRELRLRVYGADSRGRSREPERFANARAEMYWRLREAFETGTISIPDDQELIDQLGCLKYENEGKIQIWKKSKLRKELEGDSPDEADALAMTYFLPENIFRKARKKPDPYEAGEKADEESWMAM